MSFLIAFAASLVAAALAGDKQFYFDSQAYWDLPAHFTRDGHWSLLNLDNQLRGYVPALLYGGVADIARFLGISAAAAVRIFNSLLFALIGTVLVPKLAGVAFPRVSFGLGRRLVVTALILVSWRGYLAFPLSDFPALTAALVSLIAVARSRAPAALFVAGLAAGCAIDIRPAYLLLAPMLVVIALLNWRAAEVRVPRMRRIALTGVLLAGLAVILVPQSLITHRNFDMWSPLPGRPPTSRTFS